MKPRTVRIVLDAVISWAAIAGFLYFTNLCVTLAAMLFGGWNYWDGLTRRDLR